MADADESTLEKEKLKSELDEALARGTGPKIARFALACLSGAIPVAGGVIGATGGAWSEAEHDQMRQASRAEEKSDEPEP